MKNYLNEIKNFYVKNRLWIIGGLFFILMLQVCSQGGKGHHSVEIQGKDVESVEKSNEQLQPLGSMDDQVLKERPTYNSNYLLLLMGLGLLFYFALKKRWLQQLMPGIVWVSLRLRKVKSSKTRLASMAVVNKTTDSITLQPPVLVFGSPFKKSRKFRIKNNDDNVFPLTLTPNTSHGINFCLC